MLSLFLFIGACASGTAPVEKIGNAENAILRAREIGAINYAPLDLRLAEEKLAKAKSLIGQQEYQTAEKLLDEALVDAKLAEMRSRSEKEKIKTGEMRDSINALRNEIERKFQDQ